jgi:membrane-associated phospholipid phosphatase
MPSHALSSARLPALPRGNKEFRLDVGSRIALALSVALACGLLALFAVLVLTGQRLASEFADIPIVVGILALLGTLSVWRRLHWRIGDFAWSLAIVTSSMLICGLVSATGLRLGFPLADPLLLAADQAIGFDTSRAVLFTSRHDLLSRLLHWIYNASGIFCFAAALWNLVWGNRAAYWIVIITAVFAAQLTALIAIFFPGEGAILYQGLDALQGHGLPFGAGSYSAAEFRAFYWGTDLHVSRDDLAGIVVFPSFHTVMALIILQGFAASRLRWLGLAACTLTIVSTVPMGGHYVVDLAGGFLVWLASYLLAARICQGWRTPRTSMRELGAMIRSYQMKRKLQPYTR